MITAIVLTKNEEENIKGCLETLKWCDEIIVIDDNSTDKTCEIAQKMGAKIVIHPLNDNFASQRNYGLKLAKGEWVFFVDADERISKELKDEILDVLERYNQDITGIILKRKDYMFGKWLKYGEISDVKLLRLSKKNGGLWSRRVHETWQVQGKTRTLNNYLLHYPHPKLTDFLKEINFYSTLNAKEFYSQGKKVTWWQIVTYPLAKFIKNYFIKLGFIDGTEGFIHASGMSFHSFLTRAKLWQLQHGQ